jgi:hypothetical protein
VAISRMSGVVGNVGISAGSASSTVSSFGARLLLGFPQSDVSGMVPVAQM